MPKINTPLIRLYSVPVVTLERRALARRQLQLLDSRVWRRVRRQGL